MDQVLAALKQKTQQEQLYDGISDQSSGGTGPSRISFLHSPVLVLNLNYVPINVCTARRAVVLLGKGKAELLENHRGQLRTVSRAVDVPSIIRLVYLVRKPFLPRKLSKKEVFLRDRFTCQYCGKKAPDLTLDHVVPRRQHGAHTWENVVAACNRCNLRKAGRTPAEANMVLVKQPRAPGPQSLLDIAEPDYSGRVAPLRPLDATGPRNVAKPRRFTDRRQPLAG